MDQDARRVFLIEAFLRERNLLEKMTIPASEPDQRALLRALMNTREPIEASDELLAVQDAYLKEEIEKRGIQDSATLTPIGNTFPDSDLFLWKGDITSLKIGAIVNAANSSLTGCWVPGHFCIDNAIHTFAGIQLRKTCAEIIANQGHEEPVGQAKITPAFNLPCDFVLHAVGPCVSRSLTERDRKDLAACYLSCLETASAHAVLSIAFCSISTGVFGFPPSEAAKIAISTVRDWKQSTQSKMRVVFNVFSDRDLAIYQNLLQNTPR